MKDAKLHFDEQPDFPNLARPGQTVARFLNREQALLLGALILSVSLIGMVIGFTACIWMVGHAAPVSAGRVNYLVSGFGIIWSMIFLWIWSMKFSGRELFSMSLGRIGSDAYGSVFRPAKAASCSWPIAGTTH